jgi:twitching motility protein PilI
VVPCPVPVSVPLTKTWFLGVSNIRGSLFGMIDFGAFLTGEPTPRGLGARLVLLGPRFSEMRAGLVVNRVLGLRNLADYRAVEGDHSRAWASRTWRDKTDMEWRELDLPRLVQDEQFLQVGI